MKYIIIEDSDTINIDAYLPPDCSIGHKIAKVWIDDSIINEPVLKKVEIEYMIYHEDEFVKREFVSDAEVICILNTDNWMYSTSQEIVIDSIQYDVENKNVTIYLL